MGSKRRRIFGARNGRIIWFGLEAQSLDVEKWETRIGNREAGTRKQEDRNLETGVGGEE